MDTTAPSIPLANPQADTLMPPSALDSGAPPSISAPPPATIPTPAPNPAKIAKDIPPPSPTSGVEIPKFVVNNNRSTDPVPIVQSTQPEKETIYSAPITSVFFRNFVAGFSRALGGIILYIAFLALMGYISSIYLMPYLRPILKTFENLSTFQSSSSQMQLSPETTQQILNQIQKPSESQ